MKYLKHIITGITIAAGAFLTGATIAYVDVSMDYIDQVKECQIEQAKTLKRNKEVELRLLHLENKYEKQETQKPVGPTR